MSEILPLTADTFKDATPSTPSDCVNSSNIEEGALVPDPIDHDLLADDIFPIHHPNVVMIQSQKTRMSLTWALWHFHER